MKLSHRLLPVALLAAIGFCVLPTQALAQDQPTSGPKLYRWVGPDGKVHYGDDIPTDALNQARDELSRNSGMTLKHVDRALTVEERAAADAKVAADARAAEAMAKAHQNDQMLLSSYPTEGDLQRAYQDRVGMQGNNIKSIGMNLDNQQKSMSSFLYAASALELSSKPVGTDLVATIRKLRDEVVALQQSQAQSQIQMASIKQEGAATLARYRELRASAINGRLPDTAPAPAPSANPSPP